MQTYQPFRSAQPIWPQGLTTTRNIFAGFRAVFPRTPNAHTTLRITGSTLYRIRLNGQFVGHGPARAAHGFFRVDEIPLDAFPGEGPNLLTIEVAGYNVNSYYLLDQPAFLQAEVVADGTVVAATGSGDNDFEGFLLPERVRRVQRYSFQRPFIEVYRRTPDDDGWRHEIAHQREPAPMETFSTPKTLPRGLPLPDYAGCQPRQLPARGTLTSVPLPKKSWNDRFLADIGPLMKGFPENELEVNLVRELQQIAVEEHETLNDIYHPEKPLTLADRQWALLDFGVNRTGFFGMQVTCTEPVKLIPVFDEILVDGRIIFNRLDTINAVSYDLEPGTYHLETFEPYTFRYLQLQVLRGSCEIRHVFLRELANPDTQAAHFAANDHRLNDLFAAGRETFRQNAVDVFMDCPSRERACWLCDSYFTARVEADLCGHSRVEHNFLENFLLPENFDHLPDGMWPMCYPADHPDGNFIPNWALWGVLELEEYLSRSGDRDLVDAMKPKVMGLFDYFRPFKNDDGLLEGLESWVFVEWSKANDFVQDVSYPSNMLYAGALDAAGRLYGDGRFHEEALQIKDTIRAQAFDSTFFVDNATRQNGLVEVTRNRTETCQYYAFYFNIATPETHPDLWEIVRDDFGPRRAESGKHPEIYPANAFIGNVLRLEVLSRYGESQQVLTEVKNYFEDMAKRTGTLWEHNDTRASCNHGFASHVAHVLYRDVLGIQAINVPEKTITFHIPDIDLEWCAGTIPIGPHRLRIKWWIQDGERLYTVDLPAGFSLCQEEHAQ